MSIQEGTQAPDFTLPDASGTPHRLSDYRGKAVVVYFYPKDDTPGCTREACGFRDLHGELSALNAVVLGISPDPAADHQAFVEKFGLPFTLLCDEEKEVLKAYGAWGEKKNYGKTYMGVIRSTVVVAPDGTVARHWKKVPNAETHPGKVLDALKAM